MAAFEAEAEAICLLLRLDSVMFLVSRPQCIYDQKFRRKQYVQLRTAAKHIVYALLVAMHFLEIEGCESADLYQDTWN